MRKSSRRNLLVNTFLAFLAATICSPQAIAQTAYPSKPITVRTAFPAGGPADASIRAAAVVVQRNLGQSLISANVPGANGSIGAMNVLRSENDGYTLLGTTGVDFLVAPKTIASAQYSPDTFHLVGVVGISDFVLVSSSKYDFKSVDDLIEYAKKPGNKELSFGHWGPGSAPHLVGADFQARAGIKFLEVPYKGAAPTMTDVAGGQIDLTFVPLGGPTLGMIQTGRVKAIALASLKRNPALPNVPRVADSKSLPDFEYSLWSALLAPPQTPQPVVTRLTEALNEWILSPENLERIITNASRRLDPMNVQQNAAFLKSEHEKYSRLARNLKLAAQ